MSEAASARSRQVSLGAVPLGPLEPMLRAWLPRQRWFAGKGRAITRLRLVSAVELLPPEASPGLLHLLIGVDADGSSDCYQLLLGVRPNLPPALAPALIGYAEQGPYAGQAVYEGLGDPRLAALLLERLRSPGSLGPLRFDRDPAALIPASPTPRPLSGEQTNSSLIYGDSYILKVFRRVGPGVNPDLELPRALAAAGCTRVPAPVAWYEAALPGAEPLTLGVLQPYLRGSDDGWQLALRRLGAGADFTAEAHALGRATAEVHSALAGALPTLALDPEQTARLAAGMTARLAATAREVPGLRPYEAGLRGAFDALAASRGAGVAAQRIHGDLHLGQTLRTADGSWALIDFEGEPARPLADRRRPEPAVRDIAGILRSFDYAARSHRPFAPAWADDCRAAFCEGYARTTGRDPREDPVLLRAYETDKAVYEARYESRHRPDWLHVPMAAIRRLSEPQRPATHRVPPTPAVPPAPGSLSPHPSHPHPHQHPHPKPPRRPLP
ncbi:maltokinase N-terminal cap-like domain-containing protein [Streptomyces goshikiensis]|uniref:maltokinase N-terminal cap-like domain-containing protein n=1 Tax=Streptomyces goshikiensis TaxID=1942 RepID=UPI0022F3D102|nr:phosphotransferase [Streptomyces goshikiensis]WBY22170.1 phosphotransferase [Streptomyces goshikiensis]